MDGLSRPVGSLTGEGSNKGPTQSEQVSRESRLQTEHSKTFPSLLRSRACVRFYFSLQDPHIPPLQQTL